VLAQSFTDYEIIVIDDGSQDNTAEVVKGYGSKVFYTYQNNAGQSAAQNKGIKMAKGTWIALLDADDRWLPEKLERQIKVLRNNSELRWCGTNRFQTDGQRQSAVGKVRRIEKALAGQDYFDDFFKAAARGICPVITSIMMIRRDVFDEVGFYDTTFWRGQDLDLWWRIAYRYPAIGYVAEPLTVNHLDVEISELSRQRLDSKRGEDAMMLLSRHVVLAKQEGAFERFRPYVRKRLHKKVLSMVYHGFKKEVREMMSVFSEFFPWYWQTGIYTITIFPKVTAGLLRGASYLSYRLGFDKQVTRRWTGRQYIEKLDEDKH
jgi:glycosyltransferase involved in cell wall biosynthesis